MLNADSWNVAMALRIQMDSNPLQQVWPEFETHDIEWFFLNIVIQEEKISLQREQFIFFVLHHRCFKIFSSLLCD